jgi:hypothetical protein
MRQLLDLEALQADGLETVRDMRPDSPPPGLAARMALTLDELPARELPTDRLVARLCAP